MSVEDKENKENLEATHLPEQGPGVQALIHEVRQAKPRVNWQAIEAALERQGVLDGGLEGVLDGGLEGVLDDRAQSLAPARKSTKSARIVVAALLASAASVALFLWHPWSKDANTKRSVLASNGESSEALALTSSMPGMTSNSVTTSQSGPSVLTVRFPPVMWHGVSREDAIHMRGGDEIQVGHFVESSTEHGWFSVDKRLVMRLAPNTRVQLVDRGTRLRFVLERGAVAADVTPVPGGEPFAVDINNVRVAVRGTKLTVALLTDEAQKTQVRVSVAQGKAVIGKADSTSRTEGSFVPADHFAEVNGESVTVVHDFQRTHAMFKELWGSNIWADSALKLAPVASVVALGQSNPLLPSVPSASSNANGIAPVTSALTTRPSRFASREALELTWAKVFSQLRSCDIRDENGEQRILESMLTIDVDEHGLAQQTSSSAALAPASLRCVRTVIASVPWPVNEASTLRRKVTLGR